MQYLLSSEEYMELVERGRKVEAENKALVMTLCRTVANWEPRYVEGERTTPWGCILDQPGWYCDKCPVSDCCPHDAKEWSK